jgi:thiol-disulfide isomerase/thioredoxin
MTINGHGGFYKKPSNIMKKNNYILAILSVAIVLAIISIYSCEQSESQAPQYENAESQKSVSPIMQAASDGDQKPERLFDEMDITQLPPTAVPLDIGLQDVNGMTVKLSDFKGKIMFLNFWATWCPPCRFEMPAMEKLHKKLKNKDFVMLAVDLQEPAAVVKKYFKKHKLTFMSLMDTDGEVSGLFGVRSIPTTFILDKEGRIIGGAVGAREWNGQESVALFEHLINQEAVPSS